MKRMVETTSDFVSLGALLTLSMTTYLLTVDTLAWVFVVGGGVVSMVSLFLIRKYPFYAGVGVIGAAFFSTHYKLNLTDTFNLALLTAMLFLLYLTWTLGESNLLARRIKRELRGVKDDEYLREFEKVSILYDTKVVILTTVLTLIGIFIFQTSYIGVQLSEFEGAVFVMGLTAFLLFLVFLMVHVLPHRVLVREED